MQQNNDGYQQAPDYAKGQQQQQQQQQGFPGQQQQQGFPGQQQGNPHASPPPQNFGAMPSPQQGPHIAAGPSAPCLYCKSNRGYMNQKKLK